ncbi:MAG: hypothetical protein OEU86_01885, partial [Gammaproteobacteria bacterium]|nr:hypothetical protein [Gammaproteobacteria bacterium]
RGNCESANPALVIESGTLIFDTGASSAVYPTLGNIGNLALISAPSSYSNLNASNSASGIDHSDGLDGFYFEGGLCQGDTAPCGGGNVPAGGTVRFYLTSASGTTMYVVEGTTLGAAAVPVPAAVWLFGSALGLLGWMRRRVAA